ncbi:60S ribosomal protein L35 [Gregarina niphandrodes]|uniref:60S ribosomal protein L35 n=1 Tax=Gregarina niphandrodes TaxID=110365 RepID=A0A023B799_GRENI|nr:60S ribosomal protein L35 [Gregarina niphandrodes]EZG67085.1 60S ribosomal protein L35 [Gregarina niphandrodes]|eukprot:XP_011130339.1 60S ribosomal protein L35 [Gregarina niphandrodes]
MVGSGGHDTHISGTPPAHVQNARLSTTEARAKSVAELQSELIQYKEALFKARVETHTKGNRSGWHLIRQNRKNVARVLTLIQEKRVAEVREALKGKKDIPKRLRPRLTHALRMKLTPRQEALKTKKEARKVATYKQRKFAVLA